MAKGKPTAAIGFLLRICRHAKPKAFECETKQEDYNHHSLSLHDFSGLDIRITASPYLILSTQTANQLGPSIQEGLDVHVVNL